MQSTTKLPEVNLALLKKYSQKRNELRFIPKRAPGSPAPLSFGQQRVWLLTQLAPDSPFYNECATLHLPGPLDVAAFEKSFNEIIRRHEAWRTSFPIVDDQPIQMIHPASTFALSVVDLRDLPGIEREAQALHIAAAEAQLPFDLAHGPLLRATLIHLGDQEHRLFLTLHHIIFDGVSLCQVFLPELRSLYESFSTGQPTLLPDVPIQYADFAIWQREQVQGSAFAAHLAYWRNQLAGASATLNLPTDRPRPLLPTYRGAMQTFALPKHLSEALKTLSQQERVTLFMLLVAAFQTLLYRYNGQDDIVLGTTISDRNRPELQGVMGFFLNTLLLRTNLSGTPTFRELLGRVREVTLEAYAHQIVPFEYVVKDLQPERNVGQTPLFQVMMTLEPPGSTLPCGWTLTQMEVKTDTSKFDLYLELDDRPEGIIGRFEYSTDLFEATTIERMVGHWQTLLEGIVTNPAQRITELPILTGVERRLVVEEWNQTSVDYPLEQCLHTLIETQVEQSPDAIAVVFEQEQLTYRELNMRANQLAHHLQTFGVGPDVLVGVCMERSLDLVVALLGILKAGGAYVPLDPSSPKERLAFMLEDVQTPVLLTQQRLITSFPAHSATMICLDTAWEQIANEANTNPVCNVSAQNLSYTIYTSGSTGKPKGAMNTHRGLVNRLLWMQQEYHLTSADRVLQKTPFTFDVSVWEFFWPLLTGATLVVARPGGHQDACYIAALIVEQHITTLHFVPSMLHMFLQEPNLPEQTRSIKRVICSGEALPFELQERFFARIDAELHNLYGPTEASIDVTSWRCQRESKLRVVPIGRPIANTHIYLLDPSMRPVPIGVSGELYIGGVGVARGYLNRDELTQERFIADPFSPHSDARLYRTGDLARYRPDGAIEYLGRIDHQVKIRGLRIELGEIEAVLLQHPSVREREVVLVAREDTPGDQRLVAYVVPANGQTPTNESLRTYLKEQLPAYMVPSSFLLLDAFPLLSNGKVNRHALPVPTSARDIDEDSFVAPTLMVHHQLVAIWEDLLNVRPIGLKDNFFDLGGHSLLAARLVDRIERTFGKKLPLSTLFAKPTVEQLATALESETDTMSRTPLVAVQVGEAKRPFFFLHGDSTGGAFYCFPLARTLGQEQPFYALEPYRFDDMAVPPSLEVMAKAHIEALQTVQPEGPYLLGGFCNGALMAYEMARQLKTMGQKIDLLLLVDPADPPHFSLALRIVNRLCNLLRLSEEKQLNAFLHLRHLYALLPQALGTEGIEQLRAIDPSLTSLLPTTEALRKDYVGILAWSIAQYLFHPYPGKITVLWAKQERFWGTWRKKLLKEKAINFQFIPGTHTTCRTTYLSDLAEQFRICLTNAENE